MANSQIDFKLGEGSKETNKFLDQLKKNLGGVGESFKNLFSNKETNKGFDAITKGAKEADANFTSLIAKNKELGSSFATLAKAGAAAFAVFTVASTVGDLLEVYGALGKGILGVAAAFQDVGRAYEIMQAQGFNTQSIEDVRLLGETFKFNTQAAEEFAKRSTVAFNEYDSSLTRINTLLSISRDELSKYGEGIQNLVSKDLKNAVTSTQALAGQYEVLSGGFTDAAQSQQVLSAGLKLATIGQTDQGETLRLLVKTMQAYKISSSDAGKTAAILNGIVEQGITTIGELTTGFGQTATVAAQAGIKINELGAAVAVLTTKGTSSSAALTGIESLSSIIIDKTPEAAKALAELRDEAGKPIRFDIAEIKAKGLTKALQDLNKATAGNASTLAQIIPESLAYSTALGLLQNNVEDFARVSSALGDVTAKNLENVFGIALGDKTQKFTQIINRFGEVLIKFGQAIAPAFEGGIEVLDKISQVLIEMPDFLKTAAVAFVLTGIGANKAFGAFESLAGTVIKLTGIYLSQRAIGLLLSGDLGKQKDIVLSLIKANAGLIPVIKQVIGLDQQHLLTLKEGKDFSESAVKESEALSAAIEKEIAVKKANVAVDKARKTATEAKDNVDKAALEANKIESVRNELLAEQSKLRQTLVSDSASYAEQVNASTKLSVLEGELQKNSVALEKARLEEKKKLTVAEREFQELSKKESGLSGAKDDAEKIIRAKVDARKADEAASIAQATATSKLAAIEDLANQKQELGKELIEASNKAKEKALEASKLQQAALVAEAKTSELVNVNGTIRSISEETQAKAIAARTTAELAKTQAQEASIVVERIQGELTASSIKGNLAKGSAIEATTIAENAKKKAIQSNLAVEQLQDTLNKRRLVTEGKLVETKIFGNTVYAASSGIIGKVNAFLLTNLGVTKAVNAEVKKESILKTISSTINLGFAATLKIVENAAKKTWAAVSGPLAPIVLLLGAVTAGVLVFSDALFGAGAKAGKVSEEFEKINKSLDEQKKNLGAASKEFQNYSKDVRKVDVVSSIFNRIGDAIQKVKDFFNQGLDFARPFIEALPGVKAFQKGVENIQGILDIFEANGIVNVLQDIGNAQKTSQETTIALNKAINQYSAGLFASEEANQKFRKGIALTTIDLQNETKIFMDRKKFAEAEVTANEKRIEGLDELIKKKGEDSTYGKQLARERDVLTEINEKNRQRIKDLEEGQKLALATAEARAKAQKAEDLNTNEVVSKEAVIEQTARADVIKDSVVKSFGAIGSTIENSSKRVQDLSADQLSKLELQVKKTAELVQSGLLPTTEFIKKAGLDVTQLTQTQLDGLKKAIDSGSFSKINQELTTVAKETKQNFTQLNSEQVNDLSAQFKMTSTQIEGINKEALAGNIQSFAESTAQLAEIKRKAAATTQEDIGGTAFQTSAKKAFRLAQEDYEDYLEKYKAQIKGQVDETGQLFYVPLKAQKEANALAGEDREKFLKENRQSFKLTADEIKSGFDGKLTNSIEAANAALSAGAISASEFADKLRATRAQLGTLITPEQQQEISKGIVDAEKNASAQTMALLNAQQTEISALQDARLEKASDTQTELLKLEETRINESIRVKETEIAELAATGQVVAQKQAEAELTALKAQGSAARRKIDDNEIDNRFSKQKEALGRELKLLDAQMETKKLIADQDQKLTQSRFSLSRAQADQDLANIQNKAKLSGDSVEQAKAETQIAEKNFKLLDAKNEFDKQSLKTSNLLNELALERQQTQVELNKLELEATILKTKAVIADSKTSANQKEFLTLELNAYEQQKGLLNKQSDALKTAATNQKEVSKNSEKELEIRNKIAKDGGLVDIQIAKQRETIAVIDKYIQKLQNQAQIQETNGQIQLNQFDLQIKANEQLNSLIESRQAITNELSGLAEKDFSLASSLAQTEFGRRKIDREAATVKKALLLEQQKIEAIMFDLQLKSNKAARERLKIENDLLIIRSKAEVEQSKAEESKLKATAGTTPEQLAAAQANTKAKEAAVSGAIQTGELLELANKNEESLEKFKKLSFDKKQESDLGAADAAIASTTLSKSDDRRIGREARDRARGTVDDIKDVLNEFKKQSLPSIAAPTAKAIPVQLVSAPSVQLNNERVAAQVQNNRIDSNDNTKSNRKPGGDVKIEAPITIEINVDAKNATDTKQLTDNLKLDVANALKDTMKMLENM